MALFSRVELPSAYSRMYIGVEQSKSVEGLERFRDALDDLTSTEADIRARGVVYLRQAVQRLMMKSKKLHRDVVADIEGKLRVDMILPEEAEHQDDYFARFAIELWYTDLLLEALPKDGPLDESVEDDVHYFYQLVLDCIAVRGPAFRRST